MWATPAERALQLKRQQKVLREQEWNARPEWEKKRVVASIDLVGGKVVKKMARMERPRSEDEESMGEEEEEGNESFPREMARGKAKGALSKNPLMGGLIRPVARVREDGGKGKGMEKEKERVVERSTWRRVQDDNEDNEKWILDGGLHGQNTELVEKREGT